MKCTAIGTICIYDMHLRDAPHHRSFMHLHDAPLCGRAQYIVAMRNNQQSCVCRIIKLLVKGDLERMIDEHLYT